MENFKPKVSEAASKSVMDVIKDIPQCPQAQYSTAQQMQELRVAANKLGLYDAADLIKDLHKGK